MADAEYGTLLGEKQMAHLLGVSVKTLQKDRYRADGSQIPFHRLGRAVRYNAAEVLARTRVAPNG